VPNPTDEQQSDLFSKPFGKEEAWKRLVMENFEYLDDYNTENPPPANLEQADEFEKKYKTQRDLFLISIWVGIFGVVLTYAVAVTRGHVGFMFLPIVAFWAAYIFRDKTDKTLPDKIATLRKSVTLHTFSDTQFYSCLSVGLRLTITSEVPRPSYSHPENLELVNTLNQKLAIAIKTFFSSYEQKYRNDTTGVSRKPLEDPVRLPHFLEGLVLPTVCSICHDFKPAILRYTISVTPGSDFDTGPPLGKTY
jgi:hypothetical protein